MEVPAVSEQKRLTYARGDWRGRFLEALRERPIVSQAAELAGVSRAHAYRARADDDDDFAAAWDDAMEQGVDVLLEEARRRAVDGVTRPIYQGGKLIGHEQVYSDNLLARMIAAHRESWRANTTRLEGRLEGGNPTKLEVVIVDPLERLPGVTYPDDEPDDKPD